MGQQQLLLLVLGIVIVGLAVVVGIQAFSENQKKANADALVHDGVRIASEAQAWKLKPAAFGGGASKVGFTGLTLEALGYETDGGTYNNPNGAFTAEGDGNGFVITAISSSGNTVVVTISDGNEDGDWADVADVSTAVNES